MINMRELYSSVVGVRVGISLRFRTKDFSASDRPKLWACTTRREINFALESIQLVIMFMCVLFECPFPGFFEQLALQSVSQPIDWIVSISYIQGWKDHNIRIGTINSVYFLPCRY